MRDPRNVALLVLSVACAFLAGVVTQNLAWWGGAPSAQAQEGGARYGGGTASWNQHMLAATGSVGSGMSVLWLIDTKAKRLAVYGTGSLGKNVELRAARNIEWDFKLDEYNDDSQYKSEDLERLWQKQRLDRTKKKAGEGPIQPPVDDTGDR